MKNYSIIREQEYLRLAKLVLNGNILDIGGSKKSGYHELLKGNHRIVTVNINPEYGCDLIFDIQNPFPIQDSKFDHVIAMNVLEHIYDFQNVFSEVCRVLKKRGSFIFAVPFMFHIHGSPDDYFRYSKSTLIKILKENRFQDFTVEEMGFGLFSLIFQTVEIALPSILKNILKPLFVSIDKFLLYLFPTRYKSFSVKIPIGYFVIAKKSNLD